MRWWNTGLWANLRILLFILHPHTDRDDHSNSLLVPTFTEEVWEGYFPITNEGIHKTCKAKANRVFSSLRRGPLKPEADGWKGTSSLDCLFGTASCPGPCWPHTELTAEVPGTKLGLPVGRGLFWSACLSWQILNSGYVLNVSGRIFQTSLQIHLVCLAFFRLWQ